MSLFSASRPKLTTLESEQLAKLEQVVDDGLKSFSRAGKALVVIREKQWYRQTHDTFEAYVSARWSMTPQHANRLIAAAEVVVNLEPTGSAPVTERTARPLASLPPDQQRAAWSEVVEAAPKDKNGQPVVTSEMVETAAAKRRPKSKKKRAARAAKPVRIKIPGAVVTISMNRKFSGTPAEALQAAISKLNGTPELARIAA